MKYWLGQYSINPKAFMLIESMQVLIHPIIDHVWINAASVYSIMATMTLRSGCFEGCLDQFVIDDVLMQKRPIIDSWID